MSLSADTLALIKEAQKVDVSKSWTQPGSATVGLQQYNLDSTVYNLFPQLTPFRNMIARVSGGFSIQANWKAITGINTTNVRAGVSEGNRGGLISQTIKENLAAFRGYGLENSVTFEAQYTADTFADLRATGVKNLLSSVMIQEELQDLGGNTSVALGTTPTPTLAASTTGGTLGTLTLSVICVALSLRAYLDVVGINNGVTNQQLAIASAVVPASITKTNTDGSTDTFGGGSAQKSAAATVSVTGNTGSATGTVAVVNGAVGYAWYWGVGGSEVLGAVTSINSVAITANATGTQTAASMPSADNSTSSLDYDGLLYQAYKSGSGAYIAVQATGTAGTGTPLTSDGAGGIVEFETAFRVFYDRYRLSPSLAVMSSQELTNVTKKIIANGGAPLLKLNIDATRENSITAGVVIGTYVNKVTGQLVKIMVHPNMPAGTLMFYTDQIPYPLNNVTTMVRKLLRREYHQIDWALRTRKWEFGVYADGVLQHFAPFSLGIITNIGNG